MSSGPSIKLVSLNIEMSKHLGLVEKFLISEMPDVVCLQELLEHDIPRISVACPGATHIFQPMSRMISEVPGAIYGIGIFSRIKVVTHGEQYYVGRPALLPESDLSDPRTFNAANRMVMWCDVEKDGTQLRFATTHFTWTPDGRPSDEQRRNMHTLIGVLGDLGEFILTGDFNAPRGGEIFAMLTERYTDNVPAKYKTSIDIALHRDGKLRLNELIDKMVDGLFSTPAYLVSDAKMISGVSDHCALVADVSPT